jgi:integrase/recombinase XerD
MAYGDLLKGHLDYMKLRSYSVWTQDKYQRIVQVFLNWLLSEKSIERIQDVTKEVLREYENKIYSEKRIKDNQPESLGTKGGKIGALKCFFKFLAKRHHILYNPAADLDYPVMRREALKDTLKEREIQKILECPKGDTPVQIRDRAILELFYSTGIRNAELRNIRVEDFDSQQRELKIKHAKGYFGERQRVLPVGRLATAWIEEYLKNSRPKLMTKESTDFLFVSRFGRKLGGDTTWEVVKKYAMLAGIKKKVWPHLLRHSFATHLLRHGADIRHVQELLGHQSIDSTQIYTKIEISDLKKVHQKTHPRERQ